MMITFLTTISLFLISRIIGNYNNQLKQQPFFLLDENH
jgi:hypothetical protein